MCPLIFQVCPLFFQVCPLILGVCPLILGVCPLIPFNAPTKAQIKATNQSAQIKGHTWESQFYEVKSTKIKGHTLRGSYKGQHKGPLRQPPFWIASMGPSSPPPFSFADALAGALTTWAAEARCIIICIETQLYYVHVYLYSTIRGKHALNGMDPGPSWVGRGELARGSLIFFLVALVARRSLIFFPCSSSGASSWCRPGPEIVSIGFVYFVLIGCSAKQCINTQVAANKHIETHFAHQWAKQSI